MQPFVKQLYESGFQKNGGLLSCGYFDKSLLNFLPAVEMEGLLSCLDYYLSVDDPFSKQLQIDYAKKFPGTKYPFTAASGSTGMYRGLKFYEAAVIATNGDLKREAVAAAMDTAKLANGPGGGADMVPGQDAREDEHVHREMRAGGGQAPVRRDQQGRHGRSATVLTR